MKTLNAKEKEIYRKLRGCHLYDSFYSIFENGSRNKQAIYNELKKEYDLQILQDEKATGQKANNIRVGIVSSNPWLFTCGCTYEIGENVYCIYDGKSYKYNFKFNKNTLVKEYR